MVDAAAIASERVSRAVARGQRGCCVGNSISGSAVEDCPIFGHVAGASIVSAGLIVGARETHWGSSLFSVEWGEQRPLPPAHTSVAPPEPHRSLTVVPLIGDKRYYGEAPVRPAGGSGAGLEEPGARGSTVWGAKLGSDGSPRRGRRVKGQSRGTAWRVILQASPVTIPSERAMNLTFSLPGAISGPAGPRNTNMSRPTSLLPLGTPDGTVAA